MDATAVLVAALRADWDVKGILAALAQVDETRAPGAVALAAIKAALDPGNRTPAIIAMPGPHWVSPAGAWSPPPPCGRCGRVHDPSDPACPRHDPDAYTRGVAAARAALTGTKQAEQRRVESWEDW